MCLVWFGFGFLIYFFWGSGLVEYSVLLWKTGLFSLCFREEDIKSLCAMCYVKKITPYLEILFLWHTASGICSFSPRKDTASNYSVSVSAARCCPLLSVSKWVISVPQTQIPGTLRGTKVAS